jgi:hypothetical protein
MKPKTMQVILEQPKTNGLGKGIYSSTGFDYVQLIKGPPMHFPTINHGKPPHFDGTRYTDWAYKMKMHLIAVRLWDGSWCVHSHQ